ncbi:B-cell receptor CD22-like isoform X2 [Paralichthys olivaceus]|uniref:B-cell receptor CD22-like isoform X2 n=1 Tax=Paralichthys olivaceus TaxID=8255 RepID=UPI003752CEAD
MSLREAASCFVVFLLSVSGVQGADSWGVTCTPTKICAVKGSKVQIRCTYMHPPRINDHDVAVEQMFWFTNLQNSEPEDLRAVSEYAGRVQYHCGNNACTLTITDLRESDSAQYKFRFITNQPTGGFTGSPGVTLSVTGVQVLSRESSNCYSGACSKSRVECKTSCSPTPSPSYIWYKNGQKTWREESSYNQYFYSRDSFSCAVRGHEDFPSAPVCVYGNSCDRVNYIDRNICAFKGSSVNISCSYSPQYSITSKFWFVVERKDVQQYRPRPVDLLQVPEFKHRVQVFETERGRSTLRINELTLSDSAQYRFRFKSQRSEWESSLPGTTLTVTDPDVQVICSPIGPTLTCHSSCRLSARPSFVWFKNGIKIHGETSPTLREFLQPENNYSCAYEHHRSSPVYAPKVPLLQLSQTGDMMKDSSVSLTCSSDANPPPAYAWYKNNQTLFNTGAQLVFSSIQFSDSGEFYCTAENELGKTASKHVVINVKYAPQSSSVSVSPSGEIMEGSSVTLTCSSDANPAAEHTWYKENRTLLQGPEGVYRLSSISSGDSGVYSCKSENQYGQINSTSLHLDVQYAPKVPSVSVSPSGEIMEGSSVTLTCSSDANPAAKYTWYKRRGDKTPQLLSEETQFVLSSIRSSDSGEFYCTAENELGRSSANILIDVKYAPKVPSVSVSPSGEIMEGSSVTLTCSSDANPAAEHTWYKEIQTLLQGPEGVYRLSSISSADSGVYSCKSENQYGQINSTSLHLDVQYAPKVPSVSVSPSGEIMEGSSVTLTCSSVANPAANYTWYKRRGDKTPQLLSEETQFVLSSIRSSDSGEVYCTAENELGRSSANILIDVKYAPKVPSVSVSPSGEIMEGSSVTLTCSSVANPAAKYTWYKRRGDKTPQLLSEETQFVLSSIRSSDSGEFYCTAENELGRSSANILIDVKYAPKVPSVSVSPSGEIMEGSSVTLTCSSDANPAANYTWYKEDEDSPRASGQNFTITSITAEHGGNYRCEAQNRRGRSDASLHVTVGAVWTSAVIGSAAAAFLAITLLAVTLLSVFFLIRKKRNSHQSPDPGDRLDHSEQRLPNQSEEDCDLHYGSVHFMKTETDPVYSNVGSAEPSKHKEREEVVYASVNFNRSAPRGQDTAEDPDAFYSTVKKPSAV